MLTITNILGFSAVALLMVLTPGPNMIYLISRSIYQGKKAGFISLLGIAFGFFIYMILTVFGITTLLLVNSHLFEIIKILGGFYLLWLAWKAFKPTTLGIFEKSKIEINNSNLKLFTIGLLTNLLNPKIAIMYIALLPQFINGKDHFLIQAFILGFIQIIISLLINGLIVFFASKLSDFFHKNHKHIAFQKYFMGAVLTLLAINVFFTK